ncbi:C40 family peptidase [Streptomyces griseofuscus]|uniref:C40 family peptidase n=1 Tax=Streptomyces griseofuscus TaxID=146922 RepID=UPI0033D5BF04
MSGSPPAAATVSPPSPIRGLGSRGRVLLSAAGALGVLTAGSLWWTIPARGDDTGPPGRNTTTRLVPDVSPEELAKAISGYADGIPDGAERDGSGALNAIAPPVPGGPSAGKDEAPAGGTGRHSAQRAADTTPPPAHQDDPGTGGGSDARSKIVAFALSAVGKPYVYGARGPSAFDCSGLVQAAYAAAGTSLPRTSQEQSGLLAATGALLPGDILYWGRPGGATHVALYIGDGEFVGAQNPHSGVVVRRVTGSDYSGAVRPLSG